MAQQKDIALAREPFVSDWWTDISRRTRENIIMNFYSILSQQCVSFNFSIYGMHIETSIRHLTNIHNNKNWLFYLHSRVVVFCFFGHSFTYKSDIYILFYWKYMHMCTILTCQHYLYNDRAANNTNYYQKD